MKSGTHHSDESKQKISSAMTGNHNGTGYKPTEIHRRRMARAMKRRHKIKKVKIKKVMQ